MTTIPTIKVEEKLFQNRYMVDEGRPHLKIRNASACLSCPTQACTFCCPAGCYVKDADSSKVTLTADGCLECGTCRVICPENVEWNYPRGGYGVLYKFG